MTTFKIHTAETAPEKSRPVLKDIMGRLGLVPNLLGMVAESPAALKGWTDLRANLESGILSPVERRIVQLTASYLNNSAYCMAVCTTLGENDGVPRDILNDLCEDRKLKDAKLEQLRQFTKAVMRRLGRPDKADVDAFIRAGYTNAHILEVVLGVTHSIMGNYISHIVEAPLDKPFEANRVEIRRNDGRKSDAA